MVELADIATNEKHRLNGFRVLGIFPFYLKYIRTDTQIQLAAIQTEVNTISDKELSEHDFNNVEIQKKFTPLLKKYCLIGLINFRDRALEDKEKYIKLWFFKKFVVKRITKIIDDCGYKHLFNMYFMIRKLNDPSFFLTCWIDLNKKDNTLLSEGKPLSVKSSPTKKKQG